MLRSSGDGEIAFKKLYQVIREKMNVSEERFTVTSSADRMVHFSW